MKWTEDNRWTEHCLAASRSHKINEKHVVIVPSYNRPNNKTLNLLKDAKNIMTFCYVRNEQYEEYCEAWKDYPNITIVPITVPVVNVIQTRYFMVHHATHQLKLSKVFMFDDDISSLMISTVGTQKDGISYKAVANKLTPDDFLGVWRYALDEVVPYDNIGISGLIHSGSSWCQDIRKQSNMFITCGTAHAIVFLDLDIMKAKGIQYDLNGPTWEDFDLVMQFLEAGQHSILFRWLTYGTETMTTNKGGIDYSEETHAKKCSEGLYTKWGDHYIRLQVKKGIFNARCRWPRIRKDFDVHNTIPQIIRKAPVWNEE